MSDSISSITKCPYDCKGGKVFIQALGNYAPCPHCKDLTAKVLNEEITIEGKSVYDVLHIPKQYKNATFSKDTLDMSLFNKDMQTRDSVELVVSSMVEVYGDILRSTPPSKSMYIHTGMYWDNFYFVYSCLVQAFAKGLKVVPYISTAELVQMYSSYETGFGKGKLLETELGFSYLDFCTADVCFLSCEAASGAVNLTILADILYARARRGLATIVMGYWTVDTLIKKYNLNFNKLLSDDSRLSKLAPISLKRQDKDLFKQHISVGVEDIVSTWDMLSKYQI